MKCPECGGEEGHKILCKTGNDRARRYQSGLPRNRRELIARRKRLLKTRVTGPTGRKGYSVICPKDKRECCFTPCVAKEACQFP